MLDLLAGPRGRNLCLGVAAAASEAISRGLWEQNHGSATSRFESYSLLGRPTRAGAEAHSEPVDLPAELRRLPVERVVAALGPADLLCRLGETVDSALYWQPPTTDDVVALRPEVIDALRPIAEALARSPLTQWWSTDAPRKAQFAEVYAPDGAGWPDLELGAAEPDLRFIREQTFEAEGRFPPLDAELVGAVRGEWWTTPSAYAYEPRRSARRPSSTRRVEELGAVRLALMEDSHGPMRARLRRLEIADGTRICEVHDAAAWADLTTRFPIEVSRQRRKVWWEATGVDSRWFVPDFAAVASEWDAIHVSVAGYLTTAGRPTPVPGGHTLLAGWDPDQTYWLNDVVTLTGEPEEWVRDRDDATRWRREETRA